MKHVFFQLLTGFFLVCVLAIAAPMTNVFASCGYYTTSCSASTVYCRGGGNDKVLCCSTQSECDAQPTVSTSNCIQTGSCKIVGQTCCNGKQPVFAQECYQKTKCSDEGDPLPTSASKAKPLIDQCENTSSEALRTECRNCMQNNDKIWTAVGCITPTASGLISKFLPFSIGIAGGIALLLILFGALQMMMSAGNPERLNAGKELVSAAVTGLVFIIFSVFILRLVGVDILKIPGFG